MGSTTGTTAYNRPHRYLIHYSAKGYDEYRADLLRRLEKKGLVVKEGERDFLNAFIDLAAYLGEVLMTYQNAYAQEIYLETAQLRESLFGLAAMVDYRIRPGSAATGTLVVTAKSGKRGILPKGFLVSGKKENAKKDVFFETDAVMQVDSRFNDFSLAEAERFRDIVIEDTVIALEKILVLPGQYLYFRSSSVSPRADLFARVLTSTIDEKSDETTITISRQYPAAAISPEPATGSGRWEAVNADQLGVLKIQDGTLWLDGKYEKVGKSSPIVVKYGSTASYGLVSGLEFDTLPIRVGTSTRTSKGYSVTPTEPSQPDDFDNASETILFSYKMDTAEGKQKFFIIQKGIIESREVSKLRLTWFGGEPPADYPDKDSGSADILPGKSPDHIVFAGVQTSLTVKEKTRNETKLKGESLLRIDGNFSSMEKYRTLILHEESGSGKIKEQAAVLSVSYDKSADITTITLKKPIDGDFTMHGVKIWGNVVTMTQGKTVKETVLGSGEGEESYQAFDVPRSPLTFELHGKEGLEGAIDIKVSDLVWKQQDDFLDSKPGDRHYIVETDHAGKSRVVFGDGVNGSRVPTGKDNVVARFRTGQGTGGNVSAGILKKATSKPPFMDKVFNPDKTTGGSDPDTEGQLREKIPTQHITFDRAVSLQDYADLALSCSGVGKAKAGWRWLHNRTFVVLAVAGSGGEDLACNALKTLREYVDARRDPNQPLLVKQVEMVPIELSVSVIASSGYDTERVRDAVTRVLGTQVLADGTYPFFSFERLKIGMSIHKKDVYRIVENIPGVELITHLEIKRSTEPTGYLKPSFCPDDVWINNWELPELNIEKRYITVTPQQAGTLCEKAGG